MNIRIDLSTSGIVGDVRALLAGDCEAAKAKLWSGKEDFTGWVSLPEKLTCEAPDPQAKTLQDELADLKKTAEGLRLDMKKLNRDVHSKKIADSIAEDLQDAQKLGIEGTPYFLVNRLVIRGALPLDLFKGAVDMALRSDRR